MCDNERAAVPVSNFAGVACAVDILNLRGRPLVGARGHVAPSIVGAVDKYNLPFIWQEGREDVNVVEKQANRRAASKMSCLHWSH